MFWNRREALSQLIYLFSTSFTRSLFHQVNFFTYKLKWSYRMDFKSSYAEKVWNWGGWLRNFPQRKMKSPEVSDFQVTLTEHLYMYQIYHNFRKDQHFYKEGFSRVIVYNSFACFQYSCSAKTIALKNFLVPGKLQK